MHFLINLEFWFGHCIVDGDIWCLQNSNQFLISTMKIVGSYDKLLAVFHDCKSLDKIDCSINECECKFTLCPITWAFWEQKKKSLKSNRVLPVHRSAWKQLEDMSAEQAMQEYVSCVRALDPEGSQKVRIKPTVETIAWWDVKQDFSCSFAVKLFDLLCADIHKSTSSSPPRQIMENRSALYCFGEIFTS